MIEPNANTLAKGDERSIARAISWVENRHPSALNLLKTLNGESTVIGITGPPGAGKSSLVNALVNLWSDENQRIAIVAVDPSSVFNFGSLLGDRLRMQSLFLKPNVYIRSVSSRGSLGGLSGSIIEIIEVLKHSNFDKIVIETVGVGQSEVEIAGVADTTIVVSVPESGDEIQTLKSGVMEIADIFVVNKSDRAGADTFASHLRKLAHSRATKNWECAVVLTNALAKDGVQELSDQIQKHHNYNLRKDRKIHLLAEKAFKLVQQHKMKEILLTDIEKQIDKELDKPEFNLFQFVEKFYF